MITVIVLGVLIVILVIGLEWNARRTAGTRPWGGFGDDRDRARTWAEFEARQVSPDPTGRLVARDRDSRQRHCDRPLVRPTAQRAGRPSGRRGFPEATSAQ
jgi:hypothetical protein